MRHGSRDIVLLALAAGTICSVILTTQTQILKAQTPARAKPSAQQQKKTAPKRFISPPEDGYMMSPIIFKDPDCARDYLRAVEAGGLKERKQIAELVEFGCMRRVDGLYRTLNVSGTKTLTIAGKPIAVDEVALSVEYRLETLLIGSRVTHDSVFEEGWVLDAKRMRLSEAEMESYIAYLLQTSKSKDK